MHGLYGYEYNSKYECSESDLESQTETQNVTVGETGNTVTEEYANDYPVEIELTEKAQRACTNQHNEQCTQTMEVDMRNVVEHVEVHLQTESQLVYDITNMKESQTSLPNICDQKRLSVEVKENPSSVSEQFEADVEPEKKQDEYGHMKCQDNTAAAKLVDFTCEQSMIADSQIKINSDRNMNLTEAEKMNIAASSLPVESEETQLNGYDKMMATLNEAGPDTVDTKLPCCQILCNLNFDDVKFEKNSSSSESDMNLEELFANDTCMHSSTSFSTDLDVTNSSSDIQLAQNESYNTIPIQFPSANLVGNSHENKLTPTSEFELMPNVEMVMRKYSEFEEKEHKIVHCFQDTNSISKQDQSEANLIGNSLENELASKNEVELMPTMEMTTKKDSKFEESEHKIVEDPNSISKQDQSKANVIGNSLENELTSTNEVELMPTMEMTARKDSEFEEKQFKIMDHFLNTNSIIEQDHQIKDNIEKASSFDYKTSALEMLNLHRTPSDLVLGFSANSEQSKRRKPVDAMLPWPITVLSHDVHLQRASTALSESDEYVHMSSHTTRGKGDNQFMLTPNRTPEAAAVSKSASDSCEHVEIHVYNEISDIIKPTPKLMQTFSTAHSTSTCSLTTWLQQQQSTSRNQEETNGHYQNLMVDPLNTRKLFHFQRLKLKRKFHKLSGQIRSSVKLRKLKDSMIAKSGKAWKSSKKFSVKNYNKVRKQIHRAKERLASRNWRKSHRHSKHAHLSPAQVVRMSRAKQPSSYRSTMLTVPRNVLQMQETQSIRGLPEMSVLNSKESRCQSDTSPSKSHVSSSILFRQAKTSPDSVQQDLSSVQARNTKPSGFKGLHSSPNDRHENNQCKAGAWNNRKSVPMKRKQVSIHENKEDDKLYGTESSSVDQLAPCEGHSPSPTVHPSYTISGRASTRTAKQPSSKALPRQGKPYRQYKHRSPAKLKSKKELKKEYRHRPPPKVPTIILHPEIETLTLSRSSDQESSTSDSMQLPLSVSADQYYCEYSTVCRQLSESAPDEDTEQSFTDEQEDHEWSSLDPMNATLEKDDDMEVAIRQVHHYMNVNLREEPTNVIKQSATESSSARDRAFSSGTEEVYTPINPRWKMKPSKYESLHFD